MTQELCGLGVTRLSPNQVTGGDGEVARFTPVAQLKELAVGRPRLPITLLVKAASERKPCLFLLPEHVQAMYSIPGSSAPTKSQAAARLNLNQVSTLYSYLE